MASGNGGEQPLRITTREQLTQLLIDKATQDSEFHKNLLDDPKGTIVEFVRSTDEGDPEFFLPGEWNVAVLEETEMTFFFVLPPLPPKKPHPTPAHPSKPRFCFWPFC
jgi:hypothetical protein